MPKQKSKAKAAPPLSPDQRRRMETHRAMEQRYMTAVTEGPTAEELARQKAEAAAAAARALAALEVAPASARGGGDIELTNGVMMPAVGFGIADSQETLEVALSSGYRLLDTARIYRGGEHERDIGVVLQGDKWERDEIFVTTKTSSYGPKDNDYMWDPDVDARAGVLAEFEGCLERLQLEKVDLLLLHWPGPPPAGFPDRPNPLTAEQHAEKRLQMWRALEEIYQRGKARAIGVSNYTFLHLSALLPLATVPPMVNQIECHLRSAQRTLVDYCSDHDIAVTAYSPLAGCDLDNPMLTRIAGDHAVTPAAVALRFLTQRGIAVIPRSSNPDRIKDNLDVAANPRFDLSESEMEELYGLDEGGGTWQDIL